MKCKTLADLYTEAARVAKMIEGTSVKFEECIKHRNALFAGFGMPAFDGPLDSYDFALFLVENKPVFEGDVLYYGLDIPLAIESDRTYSLEKLSWNLPKPKTVMIELPVNVASYYAGLQNQDISLLREYCKKALEEQ